MRFHWAGVQSRISLAFEVSDCEEEEESHNCTDAEDVSRKTAKDEKVGETEGVDHREDLQSNSARNVSSKASKYKKTEGERCGDTVKDADGSEGEGRGDHEDLSGDDVLAACSDEDNGEKLSHTQGIDDRNELQTNLENRALKKYQEVSRRARGSRRQRMPGQEY